MKEQEEAQKERERQQRKRDQEVKEKKERNHCREMWSSSIDNSFKDTIRKT